MAEKLSAQKISNILKANSIADTEFTIIVEESVPSTNDLLLKMLADSKGDLPKTIVTADMQTSGKGRQGKTWISVPGNISVSIYWPFECTHEKLYGLSLVVGIVVARVLQKTGLNDVQLKWPNDIYWHNQKLGGILIETKHNKAGIIDAIIGIGLNIVPMDNKVEQIDQKFVSLETALQHSVDRNQILAQILIELNVALTQFMQEGFSAFTAEWQKLDSKLPSLSKDVDLMSKIINADKTKHGSDDQSV